MFLNPYRYETRQRQKRHRPLGGRSLVHMSITAAIVVSVNAN